jgi:hypothetical protein
MIHQNVHVTFWIEDGVPQFEYFSSAQLKDMLDCCAFLRKRQADGECITHIGTASEDPNCVSLMGVDTVNPGYDWKKRRTR